MSTSNDDISARIRELEVDATNKHIENVQRLSTIETKTDDIYKKLFGNGQPGLEQRVNALEQKMVKILTIIGVVMTLLEGSHIALAHYLK